MPQRRVKSHKRGRGGPRPESEQPWQRAWRQSLPQPLCPDLLKKELSSNSSACERNVQPWTFESLEVVWDVLGCNTFGACSYHEPHFFGDFPVECSMQTPPFLDLLMNIRMAVVPKHHLQIDAVCLVRHISEDDFPDSQASSHGFCVLSRLGLHCRRWNFECVP